VAGQELPRHPALHPGLLQLAQPGRIFFSVITRQAIRRGSFTSVRQPTAAIGAFIDTWIQHPTPFTWTKDADEILAKIERAKTKTKGLTDH
jgi:hypothetical protein